MEEQFDNIFENPFELSDVNNVIDDKHRNHEIKEIGDRVQIIDLSSTTHEDRNELDFVDYDELDDVIYFIVIAIRQKQQFRTSFSNYLQDLIIVNSKTNKQYRIISGHCKIFNLERNL